MIPNNYALYPSQWVQEYIETRQGFEYIETRPGFAAFLQEKIRSAGPQPLADPVIKVINWTDRTCKGPTVYYVDTADMRSIFSLFERVDVDCTSITETAASELGVEQANMIKVVPYCGRDSSPYSGDDSSVFDLSKALFVSKHKLVHCWQLCWADLETAIKCKNCPVVEHVVNVINQYGVSCCGDTCKKLIKAVISTDNPEIYQLVAKLLAPSGDLEEVIKFFTVNNCINIMQYLAEICPDQIQAAANRGTSIIDTLIYDAIVQKHDMMAKFLLDHASKDVIMLRGRNGRSLLTEAVVNGKASTAEVLIGSQWASDLIESTDDRGFTALHYAAQTGDYPIFKSLYDAYVNIDKALIRSLDGFTAFHIMIRTEQVALVSDFVNDVGLGCPLLTTTDNHNQTPLRCAADIGFSKIIDLLYEAHSQQGALLAKDDLGESTFFVMLVREQNASAIKQLIARPDFDLRLVSEVDCFQQTPMMWASARANAKICELLYEPTLKTDTLLAKSDTGHNALMFAAVNECIPNIELLTRDPDLCNQQVIGDSNGYTPLHLAVLYGVTEGCDQIYTQCSIEKVCSQTIAHKLTALHVAVLYRSMNMVELLLRDQAKADALVWIPDVDGRTALDYAWMRSPEMARLILEVGMRSYRQSILPHIHDTCFQILLEPNTPRSELILYRHSGQPPIDVLDERTQHICSITPESIGSRLDDLDRM